MSDQDFNFGPPPQRREAKNFEPPPWEAPQFEELERRKAAEREAARRVAEQAAAEQAATVTVPEAAGERQAGDAETQPASASTDAVAAGVAGAQNGGTSPGGMEKTVRGEIDENQFAAMLIELKSEEPPALRSAWKVAMVAGFFSGVMGVVLAIWGMVGLVTIKRTGATGVLGGMVLLFFGLGFTGVGAWVVFKTMREQGVL